jgi:thiamine kinase-like enzyme
LNDVEILAQAVQRVIGRGDDIAAFDLHALSDDDANRIWYVAHPGGRCIAKFPDTKSGQTISRALEYELLSIAAEVGIAPRPLGHDPVSDIVFVEELEGCSALSQEWAGADEVLGVVGRTLQRLHSLAPPVSLRRFDPLAFAAAYRTEVGESSARAALALYDECEQLVLQCAHLLSGSCLCHNDLHAGNVLTGEQVWLIDFEYAVQAAPIVDVASYVAYNELDDDAAVSLARASLTDDPSFSIVDLRAVVRIQRILGELWEIARSDNNAAS